MRSLATRPGLLDASEWDALVRHQSDVDADHSHLKRLRDAPDAADITAVQVGRQPVFGIVRCFDKLAFIVEPEQWRKRSEGLLARNERIARDVDEHRGLEEGAPEFVARASGDYPGALCDRVGDVGLDLADRRLVYERLRRLRVHTEGRSGRLAREGLT